MSTTASDQTAMWNGPSGEAWVSAQVMLDGMYEAILAELLGSVPPGADLRVLDVGCGTGASSLALAERLSPRGSVTGVDISAPMLALARQRASQLLSRASFVEGDAATLTFAHPFDRVLSRFGVMFFDDPTSAFRHLRGSLAPDGKLHFVCWRSPADNPFQTTAERAAAPLVPNFPQRSASGPGQFAFADRDFVARMLADAGFRDVDIAAFDAPCVFPAADLERYVTRLGPVGQVLSSLDGDARARVAAAVLAAFEPFVFGEEVRFTAACWSVRAHA